MMTMLWLCICGALAAAAFWYCRKYNELYRAADGMLEQVLSEERIEISGLEEGRLSALAAKCLRVQEKLNLEIGRAQEEKEQVKQLISDMSHQLKTRWPMCCFMWKCSAGRSFLRAGGRTSWRSCADRRKK